MKRNFMYIKLITFLIQSKVAEYHVELISIALSFPIIVHDFMSFAKLHSKYNTPSLIVYCDKDNPSYSSILSEVFKARQNMPLILNEKKAKESPNPNRNIKENLLFIVSTNKMLIPLMKLSSSKPRAILSIPEYDNNDVIDLRDKYWKDLKRIEGYTKDDFYKLVAEKPYLKEKNQDDRELK